MLVYGSNSLVSFKIENKLLRIFLASSLMVLYDVIAEFTAPAMKLWEFAQPYPPLQNFIMWFIASASFHSLFELFGIQTRNKHAAILFIAQMIFFSFITLIVLIP